MPSPTRLQLRPSCEMTSAGWAELRTSDPAAAKLFYAGLFGWAYYDQPMPDAPYFSVATTGAGPIAVIAPAITAQHEAPTWISHRGGPQVPDHFTSYSIFLIDGVPLTGIATTHGPNASNDPLVSFAVADVDAAVVRVNALGGRSLGDPFAAPTGRICLVADRQGAAFNIVQPVHRPSQPDRTGPQPEGHVHPR